MHPDVIAAVAKEQIADRLREAGRHKPAVRRATGHGPGGGRPHAGSETLHRFLTGSARTAEHHSASAK